ncbi:hypothetical protein DV738_g3413, partial [Chaetothyriales sp. CBS 135597]
MSQVLVVFGATGQQGSSVINQVLSSQALRSQYKLRGVTRDASKPAARELRQKDVEVVVADLDEPATVKAALAGVHTVFAMTRTIYDEQTKAREERQGRTIADAAVASGAQYLIWSTASHAGRESQGKYPVDSYDVKYDVEQYIRTLPIRSAFVAPATFMQNLLGMMAPRPLGDGTYAITNINAPEARFPWVDVVADLGKFVGTILANPEKYQGKVLAAASGIHSLEEVALLISRASGKTVKYLVTSEAEYRSHLPPAGADTIVNMFLYIQDFGFYGSGTEELVSWSIQQIHSSLVTVDNYVEIIQL